MSIERENEMSLEDLILDYIEEKPMAPKLQILADFGGSNKVQNAIQSLKIQHKIREYKSRTKNNPQYQVIK